MKKGLSCWHLSNRDTMFHCDVVIYIYSLFWMELHLNLSQIM